METVSFKVLSDTVKNNFGGHVMAGEFLVKKCGDEAFGIFTSQGLKLDEFYGKGNALIRAEKIATEYCEKINEIATREFKNMDANEVYSMEFLDVPSVGGVWSELHPGGFATQRVPSMNNVTFQSSYKTIRGGDIFFDFVIAAYPTIDQACSFMQQTMLSGNWKVVIEPWERDVTL